MLKDILTLKSKKISLLLGVLMPLFVVHIIAMSCSEYFSLKDNKSFRNKFHFLYDYILCFVFVGIFEFLLIFLNFKTSFYPIVMIMILLFHLFISFMCFDTYHEEKMEFEEKSVKD